MRPLSYLCVVILSTVCACFSPDYGSVSFTCSAVGECPSGYACQSDGLCHRDGTSLEGVDASVIDADLSSPDTSMIDADPSSPDAGSAPDASSADANMTVSNDLCGNARLLLPGTEVGTLVEASSSSDYSCGSSAQDEVFYSFTLAVASKVTLTLGSTFDTTLVLLGVTSCSSEVVCAAATVLGESIVEENLAPGTYFVAVESTSGVVGDFSLQLSVEDAVVRPANNHCEGIIVLEDGVSRTGDTGTLAQDDFTAGCGSTGGDVVYEFVVPPGDAQRAMVSISNATGFDPVLSLAASCAGAEVQCAQTLTGDSESLDVWDLDPGTYSLWVDGIDAVVAASFDIRLDLTPPPSNDSCVAPLLLSEGVVAVGTTTSASDDLELTCVVSGSTDTVHEISLASAQALLITLEPSTDWNLAASLRAKTSCSDSTDISCIAGAQATRFFNRPNQAAGDYDVIVDGLNGDRGDYEISYETRPVDTSYGYWQFTTTGTYTPLGGTATSLLLPNSADEEVFVVDLQPFSFPFFGVDRTQINLHTNGFASFDAIAEGSVAANYLNDCDLNASTPFNMIAPFWDDLRIGDSGAPTTLKHEVQGTEPNRRLVIEWGNWDFFRACGPTCLQPWTGASVSHQAVLHENGDIEFRFGPRSAPTTAGSCATPHLGCGATVGLRNSDGTDNDQVGCNIGNLVSDGTVMYFVYPR